MWHYTDVIRESELQSINEYTKHESSNDHDTKSNKENTHDSLPFAKDDTDLHTQQQLKN